MILLLIFAYVLLLVAIVEHNAKRISANFKKVYKLNDQKAQYIGVIVACLVYVPPVGLLALGLLFLNQHISGYVVCAMWVIAGLWILLGYLITESKAGNTPSA